MSFARRPHVWLAAVATAVAATAYLRPTAPGRDPAVAAVDGPLVAVHWADAERALVLRAGPGGAVLEVQTLRPPGRLERWPANRAGSELLGRLAPLAAIRALGQPDESHLAAFGLAPPTATLRLQTAAAVTELAVGGTTYGRNDFYVRSPDGQVYLLAQALLGALAHGGRSLQERSPLGVAPAALTGLRVRQGANEHQFQVRHEAGGAGPFAAAADSGARLPQASALLARVLRLRVETVGTPAASGLPAVELFMEHGASSAGPLQIWPLPAAGGATATSPAFVGPVTLQRFAAEALLQAVAGAIAEPADGVGRVPAAGGSTGARVQP